MRTKEDNLLKVADEYESSLLDNNFDNCYNNVELAATFKEIITDYKKIIKICENEGTDIGETCVVKYEYDFEESSADDKEEIINTIRDRIISLIEMCDEVPETIDRKYIKDLVDIINNCEDYDE